MAARDAVSSELSGGTAEEAVPVYPSLYGCDECERLNSIILSASCACFRESSRMELIDFMLTVD